MEPAPMKAESGDLPPDDGQWAFEIKWDGMRVLARVTSEDGPQVRLRGGRGTDVSDTFPELAAVLDAVRSDDGTVRDCTLDGEVVAFTDAGVPSFGLLQQRMHVSDRSDAARRAATVPVVFVAFDVVDVDGRPTIDLPYSERRALLESLVRPTATVQVPPSYPTGGADLLEAARRHGLEGVVAKRVGSRYEAGRRSQAWRKIKVRHTQEFVVGGWLGGLGARERTVGSLALGCRRSADGGTPELDWVGNVGTGFTDRELRRLSQLLAPLAVDDCPFAAAPTSPRGRSLHWVRPELVVQVEFAEWTSARRLRHPVYLGQREDKDAAEVTCDP